MRRPIAFVITMVTTFLACDTFAGEPGPPECSTSAARAFRAAVKRLQSRSQKTGKDLYGVVSADATFRKWVNNSKATVVDVEQYLHCGAAASAFEAQIAVLPLQCLDLEAYLDFLKRIAEAPKNQTIEWALFYAISPGDSWSSRLALSYTDPKVKSTLGAVANSPNATPGLQRIVMEILDGRTAKALEKKNTKLALSCPASK